MQYKKAKDLQASSMLKCLTFLKFSAKFYGIEGILWAAPTADLTAVITAAVLTVAYFKKLGKTEKQ